MRERIYHIVERAEDGDWLSKAYDFFMIIVIFLSIAPLAFKHPGPEWEYVDTFCLLVFIMDYVLRLITADYKFRDVQAERARRGLKTLTPEEADSVNPFLRYPFTPMAIQDLLTMLPSLVPVDYSYRPLRLFRVVRALWILRVLKFLRYFKSVDILYRVVQKTKNSLITVATLAVAYIFVSALVIYNVEPETFDNFLEAVYWATVSLTAIGYGDIYPVSAAGRIVTIISSLVGIAIVALPASIITAGYVQEINMEHPVLQMGKKNKK